MNINENLEFARAGNVGSSEIVQIKIFLPPITHALAWIHTVEQFAQTGSCLRVCVSEPFRVNGGLRFAQAGQFDWSGIARVTCTSQFAQTIVACNCKFEVCANRKVRSSEIAVLLA